ncbi:hypothetical protein N2152v2_003782 [Parachlorella kessleri]
MDAQGPVKRSGYKAFGSFHTDNVEDLVREQAWKPPKKPCAAPLSLTATTAFGAALRQHFLIDFHTWTFINHGAFGAALREAHAEAAAWRLRCEEQPLSFLDRELFPQMLRVLRELAGWVHCRPEDLALVPNATTGLNTVISSFSSRLGPKDAIFSLDVGYGSVKKMLQVLADVTGAQVVQAELRFPLARSEDIVQQVAAALPQNARLAVFDAVTSSTALRLPLEELIQLCHSRGVEVLVDGAHALGMVHLDLQALGADYYVSNCHKWLCAPRGSAFLWVHPDRKPQVRPLILSHGYGSGFTSDFIWDGCRDYAPLLGISAALRCWGALGECRIRQYQRDLLQQAVKLLVEAWGTSTLVPLELHAPCMALVGLPAGLLAAGRHAATSADAKYIQDLLHFEHRVEVPVKCIHGSLYVRISCHIYNELADYHRLAAALQAVSAQEAT